MAKKNFQKTTHIYRFQSIQLLPVPHDFWLAKTFFLLTLTFNNPGLGGAPRALQTKEHDTADLHWSVPHIQPKDGRGWKR